eukprot:CAMPEP_0175097412 /NCGR_PEP_ID=MMETSP0086_2-20121207/5273_1 /TAXON_ID=136419 /ORGANISM="Unknown Unknown, Strain D1" /LENGTH=287 /DNA_ID=CAMNT_0016370921 /DNA_START=44 /DNA_END=907 /DNA_ORIENTATION=+
MADTSSEKEMKKPLNKEEEDNGELKPHCMGHHFHYAEVIFIFLTLAGFGLFIGGFVADTIPFFPTLVTLTFLGSSAFALSLIWNLASIKRIAAAADMLAGDVETFKAENERARNMQKEKRRQDDEMKNKIGDLQKAEVLLKGSVTGLEDVKKQEEEMLAEQMAMLEARRELCDKLKQDMEDLNEQTLAEAKEELHTRCTLYFEEHDPDDDGMAVGSEEWNTLKSLLENNGIHIDESAAGDDGHLEHEEFQEFLDETLNTHFEKLKEALMRNEELREMIQEEKLKRVH